MTTRLISPRVYAEFVVPYVRDYARLLHRYGKRFALHMCGDIRTLLPLLVEAEADAVESLTPPPVGNTDAGWAHREYGDHLCVVGGIDPVILATRPADEVKAHVRALLARLDLRGNFTLGSGDAIPWGTPVENLLAVREVVEEYRR